MITITVKKRNDAYVSFVSKGHAGYAENGKDIVCAAVSFQMYSLEGWCSVHADELRKHSSKIGDGMFEIYFEGKAGKSVFEMAVIGFKQLQETYPKHIKIEYEEI